MMVKTRYWTVGEIAEMLQVSRKTVYEWIKAGRLQAATFGAKTMRVREEEYERFLKEMEEG